MRIYSRKKLWAIHLISFALIQDLLPNHLEIIIVKLRNKIGKK